MLWGIFSRYAAWLLTNPLAQEHPQCIGRDLRGTVGIAIDSPALTRRWKAADHGVDFPAIDHQCTSMKLM